MKRGISASIFAACVFLVGASATGRAQDNELLVQVWTDKTKAVPITLSGFTRSRAHV